MLSQTPKQDDTTSAGPATSNVEKEITLETLKTASTAAPSSSEPTTNTAKDVSTWLLYAMDWDTMKL